MKKRLKIILLVLITLIVFPFAVLFVFSEIHHKSTHDEVTELINREFDGKITFQDFSFSYIRRFPRVHLELSNVAVFDGTTEVISVGTLDVLLNLRSFWKKELKIEKLIVDHVVFISEIDSLGNKPQLFARNKKPSEKPKRKLLIESHQIILKNSKVYFGNLVKHNRTYIWIDRANLSLLTKDSLLIISGKLDGKLDSLISNNTVLFVGQPVTARDVKFEINLNTGRKEIVDGQVFVHTLKLTPRLIMTPFKDGQKIELHLNGEDNFDTFLDLFEFHTGLDLAQQNPDAKLGLSYNQKGFVNPFLRPYSELDFEIGDAEFSGSSLPFPLQNVAIKGNYNNGEEHSPETVELVIDTIHVEVSDSYVNGRFKLSNLKDPLIDAHLISRIDLGNFIKGNEKFKASGNVELDFYMKGKISELEKFHLDGEQRARGEINIQDLQLDLPGSGYTITLEKGTSILNNHLLEVTSLIGDFNQSAFHFKGHLKDLDEYILKKKESLTGSLVLNIETLDLNRINFEKSEKSKEEKNRLSPLKNLSLDLIVHCNKIISEYGDVHNFYLNTNLREEEVKIEELSFLFQQGIIRGNADILFSEGIVDSVYAKISGDFDELNFSLPKDSVEKNKNTKPFTIPTYIYADLDLKIREGELFTVPVKDLSLKTHLRNGIMRIPELNFEAFEAVSNINGELEFGEGGLKGVTADASVRFLQLDIEEILKTSEGKEGRNVDFDFSILPEQMDIHLDFFSGNIHYKDFNLEDVRLNVFADDQQLQLNGFHAILPFGVMNANFNVNDYRDEISYHGDVDFKFDTLHLDVFLRSLAIGIPDNEKQNEGGSGKGPAKKLSNVLPDNVDLTLTTKAARIYYGNAVVDDMDLILKYNKDSILLDKLRFGFANGQVETEGYINRGNRGHSPAYLHSVTENIGIREVLTSFNNFNQDDFTTENSSGSVSWESELYFYLDEKFYPVSNENLWKFDVAIHNAEFRQVEPIENALFFVGHKSKDDMIVSELDIVAFRDKDKLYFKDVFMNDNIANLDLYGEVDLAASEMDLDLEISLSDLFFRSKKERVVETKDGVVSLDKDSKVFLKIHGPVSEQKINMISKRKFKKSRQAMDKKIRKTEEKFLDKKKTK